LEYQRLTPNANPSGPPRRDGGRHGWPVPPGRLRERTGHELPVTHSGAVIRWVEGQKMTGSRRVLVTLVLFLVVPAVMSGCSGVWPPSGAAATDDMGQAGYVLPCLLCHEEPVGRRRSVVDESGAGGHAFGLEVLTADWCLVCHEMTQHASGSVRLWEDPGDREVVIEMAGDPSREPNEAGKVTELCTVCHRVGGYAVHTVGGAWQPACITCHDLHNPASENLMLVSASVYNRTLEIEMPVVFTARSGSGSFNDGEGTDDGICQVCHTNTAYHKYDGTGAPHNDGTNCTTCHPHSAGFLPAGGASCIACHSSRQGTRPAVVNADGTGGHHLAGGVLMDEDCVMCHEMSRHQQGTVRLWTDPGNPTTPLAVTGAPEELVPFCSSCHDSLTHPIIHTTGTAWEPVCTECHELHDPTNANLSLVRDVVHNDSLGVGKPVIFTARSGAGSFNDGKGADDGICQVCHTNTAYHKYDGTGSPHNNGMNCTVCHPHADGFTTVDGPFCIKCHSSGVPDRHHLVYDRPIPPGSVIPHPDSDRDSVPDSNYGCLSCHDENFSERRDCTACHSRRNPHDTTADTTNGY